MSHRHLWLLALCAAVGTAASAQGSKRPQVELACQSHGMGPLLDCTVRVAREGAPLDGLRLSLGASMPSMPMAHSVRPVPAAPTGQPGEYRGTLELEMLGVWAVQVDLAGPLRDRQVRTLSVQDCPDGQRCAVAAARPGAAPAPGEHKHQGKHQDKHQDKPQHKPQPQAPHTH